MQDFISSEMNHTSVKISRQKMLYWERKSNHLCVQCGKPNEDGKARCPECRTRHNEDARQARLFYKALGLCSECGKNRVFKNEKTCPECRANKVSSCNRTEEQKERYRASNRKWYWRLSEQGICVKCGRRKAVDGKKMCGKCKSKAAARMRETRMKVAIPRSERNAYGLCYVCGSSLNLDNMKICSKCYEKRKDARAKNLEEYHGEWNSKNR